MNRTIFGCLTVVLLTFVLTVPAGATLINQTFNENVNNASTVPFNHFETFVVGADFVGTGMDNFTSGSWTNVINSSNYVEATAGSPLTDVNFDMHLTTTAANGYFDFYAFNGTTLVDAARFNFNAALSNGGISGSSQPEWTMPNTSFDQAMGYYAEDLGKQSIASDAVPEPMTFVLIGTGLVGLGLLRWKPKTAAIGK